MAETTVEELPEECLSLVISLTSPGDARCSAAASSALRVAADSDLTWETFLPSDYRDIISRSVSPVEFSSKKDLFCRLSSAPLLIYGGKKTFSIDKYTNKKIYMLSARDLSIAWSSNSLYWSWKSLLGSRFPEVVELVMVCWLEIHGKISIGLLSPNTTYGAYLIIQVMDRAFGLDMVPSEVSIEIGANKVQKTLYLKSDECQRQGLKESRERENQAICPRGDGWLEVELGEFYNNGRGEEEEEVKMWFREIKGVHLKGGIVVEGIELRPK
ncbi:hypothetical protein ACS0TY_002227 [Phlomoides rotata]